MITGNFSFDGMIIEKIIAIIRNEKKCLNN